MAVSKDEALTAKVGMMGKDELIALAKGLGITLTDADLEKPAAQELNDDERCVALPAMATIGNWESAAYPGRATSVSQPFIKG